MTKALSILPIMPFSSSSVSIGYIFILVLVHSDCNILFQLINYQEFALHLRKLAYGYNCFKKLNGFQNHHQVCNMEKNTKLGEHGHPFYSNLEVMMGINVYG